MGSGSSCCQSNLHNVSRLMLNHPTSSRLRLNCLSTFCGSGPMTLHGQAEAAECSICLELISPQSKLVIGCNHVFHRQCIAAHMRYKPNEIGRCPLCRSMISAFNCGSGWKRVGWGGIGIYADMIEDHNDFSISGEEMGMTEDEKQLLLERITQCFFIEQEENSENKPKRRPAVHY
jgi:hypothetical protein